MTPDKYENRIVLFLDILGFKIVGKQPVYHQGTEKNKIVTFSVILAVFQCH